jgi:hypothetical protein
MNRPVAVLTTMRTPRGSAATVPAGAGKPVSFAPTRAEFPAHHRRPRRRPNLGSLLSMVAAVMALMSSPVAAQRDAETRVFNAPIDRVWTVTRSTLKGLGWDIDKEDREVGWIRTDSRRLEGEDYGVYAKGTKHRLRVILKAQDGGKTVVTVERRVWKEERILWMDKDEDIPTTDRGVEKQLLDAIGTSL